MLLFPPPRSLAWLVLGSLLACICLYNTTCNSNGHHAQIERFVHNRSPALTISYIPWPFDASPDPLRSFPFDPRLLPALWLHEIRTTNGSINITLPFTWSSVVDLRAYGSETCSHFLARFNLSSISDFCYDHVHDYLPWGARPSFPRNLDMPLPEKARQAISAYHLYHREAPLRIVLLGLKQGDDHGVVYPVKSYNGENWLRKDDISELGSQYIRENPHLSTICLHEQLDLLRFKLRDISVPDEHVPPSDLSRLEPSDFDVPLENYDMTSKDSKYFHEAEVSGSAGGGHYDWRFFRKLHYSDYERASVLHRMTRAWLRFSRFASLQTWLAHGSLLGWYWNGLNFPWDDDVDVQITMSSLVRLAADFNQSLVMNLIDDPSVVGANMYFVDVSPFTNRREPGNKDNVIDARFIDIATGMYVDITALGFTKNPSTIREDLDASLLQKLCMLVDPEYKQVLKSADQHLDFSRLYHEKLSEDALQLWKERELLSCRDGHFAVFKELAPLEATYFEGEKAFVPKKHTLILEREYPRGLRLKLHRGWQYNPEYGIWTRVCRLCDSEFASKEGVALESTLTSGIRHNRLNRSISAPNSGPVKIDAWIMQRNEELLGRPEFSDTN